MGSILDRDTGKASPVDEVVFGRYRLLSLIGEGGMGKVYRAHDTAIDRDVAIKLLPANLSDDPAYRERFRREAHTAARLTEPHIIPIYDTGDVNGQLYLVMPIIDGTDIQDLLGRDGPMDPGRAVHIIEQLAAALDAAHGAGLVHRDVKPSNALVTGQDFVYLIDFGVARGAASTKLTSAGVLVGTLAYMAPERFSDGIADARSDIYALTCVLHECLTATLPYPGVSVEQQITGHLTMEPPRPSEHRADLPVGFDDVIATGMAKDPDQRYSTCAELAEAARGALVTAPRNTPGSGANQTRPSRNSNLVALQKNPQEGSSQPNHASAIATSAIPRRRRWQAPVAAAVVLVVILAVGVFIYVSRPDTHPSEPADPKPTTPSASAVAENALQGLLLTPRELDTATGATGMTVTGSLTTLPDGSSQVPDKACVPLEGAGQASEYAGSNFSTVNGQRTVDPTHAHLVEQIVVLFPSAEDAQAFFATATQRWPNCASRQHDEITSAGQTESHAVGPVSNTNGMLSATVTGVLARNGSSGACERALTVANNVAIDIAACGENPSGAAVNIADQIAAKVQGSH